MPDSLLSLDRAATLALNGDVPPWAAVFAAGVSSTIVWIPAAVVAIYVIMRVYGPRRALVAVAAMALCVAAASGMSEVCKELVGRFRPTRDPQLAACVSVYSGLRGGGLYGFFSAHAANTMSVAVFTALLLRRRCLTAAALLWSLANGWSRVCLGVHYLGDVLVGFAVGAAIGAAANAACLRVWRRMPAAASRPGAEVAPSLSPSRGAAIVAAALLLTFAALALAALFAPVRGGLCMMP